ncbi:MAG: phage major capsid protein [Endomicrobium sp.]|jgi:HK97 family phage major capsid protein|nr:phage major capsid protein [Endomicrobium sp.]
MNNLEQKKLDVDIQIRSLQEDIVSGKIKADDAKKKFEELRSQKKDIEQQIALAKAPKDEVRSTADIQKALIEKRAITLSGTGAINQIRELAKELMAKTPILERVRYFYGPNASTNIPVLSPGLATPAVAAEGATSIAVDSTATLASKSITPHAYVSILPVSLETITMGTVNFDSELPSIFADAFAQAFHRGVLIGSGTGLDFKGIFNAIPSTNEIECAATGNPTIADLVQLALTVQDLTDNGVIVLAPSIYAGILADTTSGVADVYKEELIRAKTIENVRVILTSAAPSVLTAGSTVAVAGRLDDYGLGMASEIAIEPIKKVGDTNTYFQASVFANGTTIVDKNFYGLITK